MAECDWGAGQWLAELLRERKLPSMTGQGTLVPMLTDGDKLVSFCTFAPMDEIQPTELSPWIGFVYTFPSYRGKRYAGYVIDWCESMATVMGKQYIYISTDHVGLYESYGYSYMQMLRNIHDEPCRVYRKDLQKESGEKDSRMQRGGVWKTEVVKAAKQGTDMSSVCGFSCAHCFLGEWCGGCRSFFNCCSYGTLYDKCVCPNVACCNEKGLDGCYECAELINCQKGFYSNGNDGNAAKAQCLFVKKYGKEALFRVQDQLHLKHDFKKVQEILGEDIAEALRILEEHM